MPITSKSKPSRPNPLEESLQHIARLEKNDAKKSEFFMAASHQLKSPVAIIQWCLQSVMESTDIDPKNREMVWKALNQANAMSQLITDMLHVFRLVNRHGKSQTYTAVDVNAVIEQVLQQYDLAAHQRQVHLVRGPIEVLPPVYAEESFLRQALINLVDNAIKYSQVNGTVTVSSRLAKDGFVEVEVEDQGIGISEPEKLLLFSEFFRGEEARIHTADGTGLGLVLVKHIIEEFSGEVVVKSRVHRGSSFTVRLPSAKAK